MLRAALFIFLGRSYLVLFRLKPGQFFAVCRWNIINCQLSRSEALVIRLFFEQWFIVASSGIQFVVLSRGGTDALSLFQNLLGVFSSSASAVSSHGFGGLDL